MSRRHGKSLSIGTMAAVLFSASIILNVDASTIVWVAPGVQVNDNTNEPEFEPHIVSKRGSANILVSAMIKVTSVTTSTCDVYQTTDTAQTTNNWVKGTLDADPAAGFATGADPVVASFANGDLLMSCVGLAFSEDGTQIVGSAITIFESTDNGETWTLQNTIEVEDYRTADDDIQVDKPWIAIDWGADTNYRDRIYLCWTEFNYNAGSSGGERTSIYFARVNLGNANDQLTDVKQLDSVQWDSNATRYEGPYVQGCQIATGPGQSGNSGNEIFVVWEKITGLTDGEIRFNANYRGGSTSNWEYDTLNSNTVGNIGTITRFENFGCADPERIFDGCLPGDPQAYRVGHIPAITVNKLGNPIVAWTDYDQTNNFAFIEVNSIYDAGTANENPSWNSEFKVTGSNDKDRREPALTMYDDGSTRGLIIMTTLNDVSGTDNKWKQFSYHCHATADSGAGSCNDTWSNGPINENDITDNDQRTFVGDYHGVASTTNRAAINTFAWHRFVPFAFISDIISYSGGGGVGIKSVRISDGTEITGMFANVYDSNNNWIASGYTPFYVPVHNSGTYHIDYSNYGSLYFTNTNTTSNYYVANWGGGRVTVTLSNNDVTYVHARYYDDSNPGTYVKMTYAANDTNGNAISGMYGGFKDINGNVETQGYTPYTVGVKKNFYLEVIWNNFGTKVYQRADLAPNSGNEELSDTQTTWGGVQEITLTGTGPYTDTGIYTP